MCAGVSTVNMCGLKIPSDCRHNDETLLGSFLRTQCRLLRASGQVGGQAAHFQPAQAHCIEIL